MTWIFLPPITFAPHLDGGGGLVRLAADQLVALLDRHHLLHLRPGGQRLQALMRPLVPDGADDRPFHPASTCGR